LGRFRVSISFLISFHCWAAQRPEPVPPRASEPANELQVKVNVYNGLRLPSDQLIRSEREAARIFRYAAIQLNWASGLWGNDVNDSTPSARWNPPTLQWRIWPRAAAGNWLSSADTLGFCLSFDNGEAVVLSDAIQEHVVFGGADFADLLGLAMAHELGHLLLRSTAHSARGIMRARLTERTLRDDARGYLRFDSGEAEFMRKEVSRRHALK
jgi:hypothetical protein